MEKREEVKNKLKDLAKGILGIFDADKAEVKMGEALLNDGVTLISYDGDVLATGSIVSVVDTNGELLPMPEGSYSLEDGTTFDVVDATGLVDNVGLVEEEVEQEAEKPASAEVKKEVRDAKRTVETVTKESEFKKEEMQEEIKEVKKVDFVAQIKEELKSRDEQIADLKDQFEKQGKIMVSMKELLEIVASEPAAEPKEKRKFSLTRHKESKGELRNEIKGNPFIK